MFQKRERKKVGEGLKGERGKEEEDGEREKLSSPKATALFKGKRETN